MKNLLAQLRQRRGFDVQQYLVAKRAKLQQFFAEQQLDCCVVGVSGGIDSAVALALLNTIPDLHVVPLLMPIFGDGTSGQSEALGLGLEQCLALKLSPVVVDLSETYKAFVAASKSRYTPGPQTAWANGQLASIIRTPCLYYHAALLQEQGYRSIVAGTTNRDEGGYIGFFGKASDAMVDLQPIADLHKSEVYAVGRELGVIQDILDREPRGDVWDNRTDEQMIGAPYWFIELFTLMRDELLSPNAIGDALDSFDTQTSDQYWSYNQAVEGLHKTNSHKYRVGSPAHFVDVMPRKVFNGWQ